MTAWGMTSWGFLGWMCILGGDSPLLPKTQPRAVPCRPSEWNRCQFPPPPPIAQPWGGPCRAGGLTRRPTAHKTLPKRCPLPPRPLSEVTPRRLRLLSRGNAPLRVLPAAPAPRLPIRSPRFPAAA